MALEACEEQEGCYLDCWVPFNKTNKPTENPPKTTCRGSLAIALDCNQKGDKFLSSDRKIMIINLSKKEHARACLINEGNDTVAGEDYGTHLGG